MAGLGLINGGKRGTSSDFGEIEISDLVGGGVAAAVVVKVTRRQEQFVSPTREAHARIFSSLRVKLAGTHTFEVETRTHSETQRQTHNWRIKDFFHLGC